MTSPTSLTSRAVISTLNVGAWRVNKLNAGETAAVNAKHGVKNKARVSVFICDHAALLEIYTVHTEARAEHYRLTLPAGDKGLRFLPVNRQVEHRQIMQRFADRIDELLVQFRRDYPAERAAAPTRLGGLYVERQWPANVEDVVGRFTFTVRYLPVPEQGQWQEWMAEAATAAQDDLRERLRLAITHVATKLSDPKGIFRDTLTGNLAEIIALVPDLNLANDPAIAAIADKAKALLEHDVQTLREDPIARAETAATATEIVNLFNLTPASTHES